MVRGVFITGTDTEVGKTFCSVKLIEALQLNNITACGYKPIASGADFVAGSLQNNDAQLLRQCSSVDLPYETINPYVYQPAVSPNIAANRISQQADLNRISDCFNQIADRVDLVVVEGAGGWQTPLSDDLYSVDLVRSLNIPVVLVVGLKLGCINHALLTLNALQHDQVNVAGWIINGPLESLLCVDEVIQSLQERIALPLLARIDNCSGYGSKTPSFNLRLLHDR